MSRAILIGENSIMKKEYSHTDVSDKYKCVKCGKPIKERLVKSKQVKPKLCYKHWIRENV